MTNTFVAPLGVLALALAFAGLQAWRNKNDGRDVAFLLVSSALTASGAAAAAWA